MAGASVLGIVAGLPFGVNPVNIMLKYVLPVMGGGNGAGAVPLSQIYETVTGDAAANYYSFAITAGLCMANRGGSGDLAVLGASNRMGLIAYAQLSSRLGGGIVLILGSVLFGAFL